MPRCVFRLFLTSLLLAVKFNDDFYYANRRYAEVGCLTSTAELNGLEATMLKLVGKLIFPDSVLVLHIVLSFQTSRFMWDQKNMCAIGSSFLV